MKFLKSIFLLIGIIFFSSCEDYFGEDANVDPDNPTTVTPNVMLPQVQARLVYTYWGDMARYVGINTQHVDGVSRQFAVIGQYGLSGADVDATWSNIYSGTLNSNKQLYNVAVEKGFNHYAAMALALESYAMLISTDLWGDLPYSDAFLFADKGVYSPTFDTQEAIFASIISNLGTARDLFAGDGGGSTPGSDDLIYGGDTGAWTKFCNVLEARAQLHLSKRNGASAYSAVLAAIGNGGFASSADNATFSFGSAATENAPWFQYIEQRDDCEVGATYVALLEGLNDPRMATYGQPHTNDHPIWTADQTVNLLSFTEQEFMRAEAMLGNNSDGAYDAYINGINSSMVEAQAAAGAEDYIAQSSVGVGAANLTLENVITQKYIALYTDPEVFSDWRRTGFPALSPITGTEVPRRFPYAQSEFFSNPENTPSPVDATLFSRVWWDQ